jgi:protein-S-isoprenylcysteine O-methyltransferase Ste14
MRNPMYLGVFSVILGWAIAFRSLAVAEYAVAVAVGFHIVVLAVEEPALQTEFGTAYAEYCRHVRRWLPGRAWPAT